MLEHEHAPNVSGTPPPPPSPPPLLSGVSIGLGSIGTLDVGTVSVRNWSRVARCDLVTPGGGRHDVFVKQWLDRVGRSHHSGFVGDRECVEALPDEVADGVFVLRPIAHDETRLLAVYPHIELATLDDVTGDTDLPVVVGSRIGRALAEIITGRTLADDDSTTAVWKGLDPKNVGLDADGRLHVFDFGPATTLPVAEAAARAMSAGLLSQWRAALGSHLLQPSSELLQALCEPMVHLTDFASVKRSLDDQADLRRSEPQRQGLAAGAVRVGLATAGRRHWRILEDIAQHLFETRAQPSLARPFVQDRVSVVLLNWNSGDLGAAAARSVVEQSWGDTELIVVDNASDDDSLAAIRAAAPTATVIEMDTNVGFGPGMNAGMAAATGEFILPLNCDARLEADYVASAVDGLRRHSRAAAVGGRVESPRVGATGPLRITAFMRTEPGDLDVAGRADKVNGACPVFRRVALAQVQQAFGGPYDESYGMYGEDIDLALTLHRLGWDYHYEPGAVAHHVRSFGSAPKLADRRGPLRRSTLANRHRNIERHGRWPLALHLGAAGQDLGFVGLQLARGDREVAADVLGAWREAALARRDDRRKRNRLAPRDLRARFAPARERTRSGGLADLVVRQLDRVSGGETVVVHDDTGSLSARLAALRPDLDQVPSGAPVAVVVLDPEPTRTAGLVADVVAPDVRHVIAVAAAPTSSIHRWRTALAATGLRLIHLEHHPGSKAEPGALVALLEAAPRDRTGD